jgi:hypothetical protein
VIHQLLLAAPSLLDLGEGFEIEEILEVAVAALAVVLLALSLSAYRKTRLSRLLIVSAAFGLFAVDVFVRQLDFFVFAVGVETDEIITTLMEFVILVLFFLAVTRK